MVTSAVNVVLNNICRLLKNNNGAGNNEKERGATSKKRRQRLSNAQKLALEEQFEVGLPSFVYC